MEDRDEKIGSEPETEAHRKRGAKIRATDEAPKEGTTGDTEERDADVELHRTTTTRTTTT